MKLQTGPATDSSRRVEGPPAVSKHGLATNRPVIRRASGEPSGACGGKRRGGRAGVEQFFVGGASRRQTGHEVLRATSGAGLVFPK